MTGVYLHVVKFHSKIYGVHFLYCKSYMALPGQEWQTRGPLANVVLEMNCFAS